MPKKRDDRMKEITKTYKVYEFDELKEEAQARAINDEINNTIEHCAYEDMTADQQRAVDKAEEMRTPWFAGSYMYEYALDEIKELCRGYFFLEDGSYFWQGECGLD